MKIPDFAHTNLQPLADRDLKFLMENFPEPGRSYEEISQIIDRLPTTLDSMLDSEFVFQKIWEQRAVLLDISPFLFFNVLLRRSVDNPRTANDRKVINYIANLLSLFVKAERLYRIHRGDSQTYEYLVDMIEEAARADTHRQFLVYSHIGNYTLWLTGLFPEWLEYRRRYKRRPVDVSFFTNSGRAYFERAASHPLAQEYGLNDVFLRLAMMFDHYKSGLNHMAREYLCAC
ncbi:MAG: hypothetical protein ACE5LB_18190 [Acidiferrobacterales bacterium]